MNTSRSFNRSKRKKAIPLHFQKGHTSLQDILRTASYKRRIKELLKNNKELAITIQDAKYKAANQQNKIEEYARTTTQVAHARMKLREMVTNLQKLVTDVDEVATLLDVGSFNILKNTQSSDIRMRLALPETSTIEESASGSILEADTTATEKSTENSAEIEVTCTPVKKDNLFTGNLRTSLAKVDTILKGYSVETQQIKNDENHAEAPNASISVESPSTPQLEIIRPKKTGKLEAFLQNYRESPRKPLQPLNKLPLGKSTTNTFVSKIPKVVAAQHFETQDENVLLTPQLINKAPSRRDTFVVQKQSNVPSATDRRGTFTINFSDNKAHNDRRETYLVPPIPVPSIPEMTVPALNLNVPDPPSVNELPNKTILLCEDMELTEIIPTQKIWSEEAVEGMATLKNNGPVTLPASVATLPASVTENAEIVPIFKPPLSTMQNKVIEKTNSTFVKNTALNKKSSDTGAVEKVLDDDCFTKPTEPKSKASSLHGLSKSTNLLEQKQSSDLEDKADSEGSEIINSRKKSAENEVTVCSERKTKSRSSSMSKRKSLAQRKSVRFSNVKLKATNGKSSSMTSSAESLPTKSSEVNVLSDINNSLLSDITLSPSPSPNKRSSRNKTTLFKKYFEDTSDSPNEVNFAPGRKVLNFFETRKSLVPNKRKFVFTNSSKKAESESDAADGKTLPDDTREDVYQFSASDSESPSANKKHKKRKHTKRSHSTARAKGKKEGLSKKPRSEKTSEHCEKGDQEPCSEKYDLNPQKLSTTSENNLKPKSTETSPDSFVIGINMEESPKVKQLADLKGDRIFSVFSNEIRRTPSRQCKKSFLAEANRKESSFPKKDVVTVPSATTDVYGPSPLDKIEVLSGLDCGSREAQGTSSARSSKLSGEKLKEKRPFSGVSERRSKKKSTLDSPDFFDQIQKNIPLMEDLPKATVLNDEVFSLDLGTTEVNNCNMVGTKVQKSNLNNSKQVSELKKNIQENVNLKKTVEPAQTTKSKTKPLDEKVNCPSFGDITEVYNLKDLIGAKSQKSNLDTAKQVTEEMRQPPHNEKLKTLEHPQITKAKHIIPHEEILYPSLDEKTEVYNLKDLIGSKGQKRNLDNAKQVTEEKSQSQTNEKLKKISEHPQITKAKHTLTHEETLHPSLDEMTEVCNLKDVIGAKVQKRNLDVAKQITEEKRQPLQDKKLKKTSENPQITKHTVPHEETLNPSLDEKTEVYNLKDLIGAKVRKRNLDSPKQESKTKQVRRDENLFKKTDPPRTERDLLSVKETLPSSLTKMEKPVKDSKKDMEIREEECEGNIMEDTSFSTQTAALPLDKKALKSSNQEVMAKTVKHAETNEKTSSQDVIPKDVLCSIEAIAPILSNKRNVLIKDKNDNKHREKLQKKVISTQSIKSKTPLDAEPSIPTNIKNSASVFNKAEFKNYQLDDLSNNDFIPSKSTKKASKKKAVLTKMDNIQPKKSHQNHSESEDVQVKLTVTTPVATSQPLRQSKTAHNTDVGPAEIIEPATVRRRNGSGSIDSLCNAVSKDQAGSRPSRSTRTTKSFKEPTLNCKMRR